MTREELLPTQCWSCWWREGGNCYLKGRTHMEGCTQVGTEITQDLLVSCTSYLNKRKALSSVIPNEMLVITSEYAVK